MCAQPKICNLQRGPGGPGSAGDRGLRQTWWRRCIWKLILRPQSNACSHLSASIICCVLSHPGSAALRRVSLAGAAPAVEPAAEPPAGLFSVPPAGSEFIPAACHFKTALSSQLIQEQRVKAALICRNTCSPTAAHSEEPRGCFPPSALI